MKCDELIEKIKQADDDYRHKFIPINLDIEIEDVLGAFAELKAALDRSDKSAIGWNKKWLEATHEIESLKAENLDLKAKNVELQSFYDLHGNVDNYIDKLKAENERLKKCEIWMKQHFYCEEVIACESAKNRQLKRALWLARAMRAEAQWNRQLRDAGIAFAIGENKYWDSWNQKQKKWQGVERKCRAKAEEYK